MIKCRGCGAQLDSADAICDLGSQPLANALLSEDQLAQPEVHYPLRPLVCRSCLLIQLPEVPASNDIFTAGYPFFSGQSATWKAHCENFAAAAVEQFGLGPESRVLEIGSNDGTMLRPFRDLGIRATGVEPASGAAHYALCDGLSTIITWWGSAAASNLCGPWSHGGYRADLVIADNVLAHVPDLSDFLRGVEQVMAPDGAAVFEVPYVGNMIAGKQWDQIYAEHHCYFSVRSISHVLRNAGLEVFDIERVPTHGGSIRVYTRRLSQRRGSDVLDTAIADELSEGLLEPSTYIAFASEPAACKISALQTLTRIRADGLTVAGYGASAKAAVTLNYFGVGPELIGAVADTTPVKQGMYMPGVRVPIVTPARLAELRPDVVVNFAWNWRDEAEANIREACPNATIMYLKGEEIAAQCESFSESV